jgi:hypothetical protein
MGINVYTSISASIIFAGPLFPSTQHGAGVGMSTLCTHCAKCFLHIKMCWFDKKFGGLRQIRHLVWIEERKLLTEL